VVVVVDMVVLQVLAVLVAAALVLEVMQMEQQALPILAAAVAARLVLQEIAAHTTEAQEVPGSSSLRSINKDLWKPKSTDFSA
jgi:H+/Cl- antiporter ClcA